MLPRGHKMPIRLPLQRSRQVSIRAVSSERQMLLLAVKNLKTGVRPNPRGAQCPKNVMPSSKDHELHFLMERLPHDLSQQLHRIEHKQTKISRQQIVRMAQRLHHTQLDVRLRVEKWRPEGLKAFSYELFHQEEETRTPRTKTEPKNQFSTAACSLIRSWHSQATTSLMQAVRPKTFQRSKLTHLSIHQIPFTVRYGKMHILAFISLAHPVGKGT